MSFFLVQTPNKLAPCVPKDYETLTMHVLLLLLLVSFAIALVFLGLFWWCVRAGEFDDLKGASARIFSQEKQKKQL